MYLLIEENPNCAGDERVFSTSGEKRAVAQLQIDLPDNGGTAWCDVTAVGENGSFGPAFCQRIEDSSDGTAWLIFGQEWGLRFRPESPPTPWSLTDKTQWGAPFKVLDSSGSSIRFK